MSWHYLAAQAGESSEAICAGGEPWQPSRLKSIHGRFCCNGKLTESYLDSLSGTTLKHSTENRGAEKSMSLPEDFPAKIFPLPGKEPASPENGLAYGQKWPELLAKYDHDSHSWRTAQCSLLGDLELFSETWPKWGIMQDGVSWELMMPEQFTIEKDYGYWPTPTATDWKATGKIETLKKLGDPLQAGHQNRPMYEYSRRNNTKMPLSASEMMNLFPIGWTDLKPLEMDRFRRWLALHGISYQRDLIREKVKNENGI